MISCQCHGSSPAQSYYLTQWYNWGISLGTNLGAETEKNDCASYHFTMPQVPGHITTLIFLLMHHKHTFVFVLLVALKHCSPIGFQNHGQICEGVLQMPSLLSLKINLLPTSLFFFLFLPRIINGCR